MQSLLLTIKIGNSNVTFGVFESSNLLVHWRVHTEREQTADEYALILDDLFANDNLALPRGEIAASGWQGVIMVSVVPPLTTTFQELCRRYWGIEPLLVGPKLKRGMPIRYENPRALGTDRLVAAIAARSRFGSPVIVIDFGTATTFNAVNRSGEFMGGAIAPGLALGAEALYQSTAQLPRIDLAAPSRVIATNTTEGIQSGILFGHVGMVEGMVARMRSEMGERNVPVVGTGGLVRLIAPHAGIINHVDPYLVLHGLRLIFDMNVGRG